MRKIIIFEQMIEGGILDKSHVIKSSYNHFIIMGRIVSLMGLVLVDMAFTSFFFLFFEYATKRPALANYKRFVLRFLSQLKCSVPYRDLIHSELHAVRIPPK